MGKSHNSRGGKDRSPTVVDYTQGKPHVAGNDPKERTAKVTGPTSALLKAPKPDSIAKVYVVDGAVDVRSQITLGMNIGFGFWIGTAILTITIGLVATLLGLIFGFTLWGKL